MYTASVQVIPIGGELGDLIDEVVGVIRSSGLRYEVNAHSTVVEGDLEEIENLFHEIVKTCEKIARRCVVNLQIDLKSGGVTIDEKVSRYRG